MKETSTSSPCRENTELRYIMSRGAILGAGDTRRKPDMSVRLVVGNEEAPLNYEGRRRRRWHRREEGCEEVGWAHRHPY